MSLQSINATNASSYYQYPYTTNTTANAYNGYSNASYADLNQAYMDYYRNQPVQQPQRKSFTLWNMLKWTVLGYAGYKAFFWLGGDNFFNTTGKQTLEKVQAAIQRQSHGQALKFGVVASVVMMALDWLLKKPQPKQPVNAFALV